MIGLYDVHCHILPGVDDGARSMDDAMALLKIEYEDGIRTIYLTPHFRYQMFEPTGERIEKQYELLQLNAQKEFPDLRLELGCEFHSCISMVDMLRMHNRFTMGESRCVLTEFSSGDDRKWIRNRCNDLLYHGYQPIIAHAERYPALYGKYEELEQLSQMGAYIQINAESILGKSGFGVKQFCKKLMKLDLLHLVGSDAHDLKHRRPVMGKCAAYIGKVMGEDYAKRIFIENPQNIMEMGERYGCESAKR